MTKRFVLIVGVFVMQVSCAVPPDPRSARAPATDEQLAQQTRVEESAAQQLDRALLESQSISVVPDRRGGATIATEFGAWYVGPGLGTKPMTLPSDGPPASVQTPGKIRDAKTLLGLLRGETHRARRLERENRILRATLRQLQGDFSDYRRKRVSL